jgi:hypothetical protein
VYYSYRAYDHTFTKERDEREQKANVPETGAIQVHTFTKESGDREQKANVPETEAIQVHTFTKESGDRKQKANVPETEAIQVHSFTKERDDHEKKANVPETDAIQVCPIQVATIPERVDESESSVASDTSIQDASSAFMRGVCNN